MNSGRSSGPVRLRSAFVNQPWNHARPPVDVGSVAIWTSEVAGTFGTEVDTAIVSRRLEDLADEAWYDGVEYLRVGSSPEPFGPIAGLRARLLSRGVPRFADRDYYGAYFRGAAVRLARWNPDVVHVHNLFQSLPVLRARLPRARLLLHMHCEWLSQLPASHVRPFLEAADAIATCSHHVREELVKALPEWSARSCTLPNGVDTAAFDCAQRPAPRTTSILFVGRISPEKGLHVLVDAFRRVASRFDDVTLQIVGPEANTPAEFLADLATDPLTKALARFYDAEPYIEHLRRQIPDHLAHRVLFTGALGHRDLPPRYRTAAMLVNPSISESFGMSVIEAMACGCPVIVARTGGMKSLVEPEVSGLVVPPEDADALATAMIRFLEDGALAQRCAAEGRAQTVRRYDWASVTAQTLELHRRLAEGRVPAAHPLTAARGSEAESAYVPRP